MVAARCIANADTDGLAVKSATWSLGITSRWPGTTGSNGSMTTPMLVRRITVAGSDPATMRQNTQSWLTTPPGTCSSSPQSVSHGESTVWYEVGDPAVDQHLDHG